MLKEFGPMLMCKIEVKFFSSAKNGSLILLIRVEMLNKFLHFHNICQKGLRQKEKGFVLLLEDTHFGPM